ncbi:MAG TPA: TIGR04282 family arsenosugar biosynthesis glycosyltransferase [Gemmataceae bacterium]|nr:TIGR04282 family arsenosugar biosynthesis glycosyltransferase [Gemmataceae bacterium]
MVLRQRRTLGLFAKWPQAGQVKTRLAAQTSPEWAAQIALAFLRDTLTRLTSISARRVLACSGADTADQFAAIVQNQFELEPQSHGDLGQRMSAFFTACLANGDERVVLVGADSPTLPLSYIETAFDALAVADVVLCPATDGGYCLMGCAGQAPPVFDGITWGGTNVLSETVARIKTAKLKLALLPPWYDVDMLEDWHMLRGHVAAMRLAGLDPGVPFTEALFNQSSPTAFELP